MGAKWRFWENSHSSLGIKPELLFPTGDNDKGLGIGRTSVAVTLLASHTGGLWTVHGNVGFGAYRYEDAGQREANHRLVWRTSVAAGYQVNEQLLLIADTGIAKNLQKNVKKHPVFLLFGFIYSPKTNVDLDFGIKMGLNAAEVDRQTGIGYTLRF